MNRNADALGYYAVLEVHPEADAAVIKRQYYDKAKYWHPDHNEIRGLWKCFKKFPWHMTF